MDNAAKALSSARKDEQVTIKISGHVVLTPAPFEKFTPSGGPVAYARTLRSDYNEKPISHSYKGIVPSITKAKAAQVLRYFKRKHEWKISLRKKSGSGSSGLSLDQAAAMLTALMLVPESQRTGQNKLFGASLRRIEKDGTFTGNDAYTKNDAAVTQFQQGGKRKWRKNIGSGELRKETEITMDGYASSSSDEDDDNPSSKRRRRTSLRVRDLTPEEQKNSYSFLMSTAKEMRDVRQTLGVKEKQFVKDNFPQLERSI